METLVVMLAGAGQTEAERISNLASKRWQRGCARDAFLLCQWLANASCSSKRQKRMRLERWKRLLVRSPRSPEHKRGGSSRVTLTGEVLPRRKKKLKAIVLPLSDRILTVLLRAGTWRCRRGSPSMAEATQDRTTPFVIP